MRRSVLLRAAPAVLLAVVLSGCAGTAPGNRPASARGGYDPYLLPEVRDISPRAIGLMAMGAIYI